MLVQRHSLAERTLLRIRPSLFLRRANATDSFTLVQQAVIVGTAF